MRRRAFLKGCCAAAVGSALPLTAYWSPLSAAGRTSNDVLVYLFLRGGIDGLHLLAPYAGSERGHYELLRDNLAIPESDLRPISPQWGLHPRAGGAAGDPVDSSARWLHRLWNLGKLAIVQGSGMPAHLSRSHFDAQAWIDLGTPGDKSTADGWITRYLATASNLPAAAISPVFGFADTRPVSLTGSNDALTVASPENFEVDGFHWSWNETNDEIPEHEGAHHRLASLWASGSDPLADSGRETAEALEWMRAVDFGAYAPEGGAAYPGGTLGDQLRSLAQLIKMDAGIVAATLDYGGWDTHAGQGMPDPGNAGHYDYFGNRVEELSRALDAFYTDLSASSQGDLMNRVNVVVLSEFGRKVRPNESAGTDHGHGNLMMALGGRVNGGAFYGGFPGLDAASLFEGQDLATTTDYRQVLAEALVRRMGLGVGQLPQVLPDLGAYSPLGIFDS
jgi:uncharacterized protein (DUF1501 family)